MRRVILILLFGYLCFNAQEAQAFIYSHGGEKISKVADLPDEEKWYLNGEYADLAVIYEQSSILWIPMWNSDARYCAAPSQGDHYIPLANSDELIAEYGSPASRIPFWDRVGGKLLLILLLIWAQKTNKG